MLIAMIIVSILLSPGVPSVQGREHWEIRQDRTLEGGNFRRATGED